MQFPLHGLVEPQALGIEGLAAADAVLDVLADLSQQRFPFAAVNDGGRLQVMTGQGVLGPVVAADDDGASAHGFSTSTTLEWNCLRSASGSCGS